jgi:hypothetical protein
MPSLFLVMRFPEYVTELLLPFPSAAQAQVILTLPMPWCDCLYWALLMGLCQIKVAHLLDPLADLLDPLADLLRYVTG